jgi:hypothetical protein
MDQKFKKFGDDDDNSFDAGFKIPETKSVLAGLQDQLRGQHQEEMDEEDKKKGKNKKRQKRPGGEICCCGNPFCRIGPFNQIEGKEE